jgi:hypothetical protein
MIPELLEDGMPDKDASPAGEPHGSPAPTVTQVVWSSVTGTQLEELLYGLLDAMGAGSLTWRAGSVTGVTAADGGRDLEAVFDRASPDGELDRQRWWVECKGRSETVERNAVQQAVFDASGRNDVDILVVATNSRFSNPTRDWVAEHVRSFVRPIVKLWDRDNLDRLVRQYPTVVARVLPDALPDEDRLRLLVARFQELGEEPTLLDLEFFWERGDWLKGLESELLSSAVIMFLYTEGVPLPRKRRWWRLLQEEDAPYAAFMALLDLSRIRGDQLPRPLETIRTLASAGRVITACLLLLPDDAGLGITLNPWRYAVGGEDVADDQEQLAEWHQIVLIPVLSFIRSELLGACSYDCNRVTGGSPHETESLNAKEFWQILNRPDWEPDDGILVTEKDDGPCTVGLDMTSGCPLIVSNNLSCERIIREIQVVLRFRENHWDDFAPETNYRWTSGRATILYNHGLAYKTVRVPSTEAESRD